MQTPRLLARWSARAGGYFWLPCPLCNRYFGGQEWRSINGHMMDIPTGQGWSGTAICPNCVAAGRGCQAWAKNRPPLACATCRSSLLA